VCVSIRYRDRKTASYAALGIAAQHPTLRAFGAIAV
jgi:hypothetical protein